MGKQTYQDNFRVVLYPNLIGNCAYMRIPERLIEPDEARRRKYYQDAAREIASQARRHVDGCTVAVESDTVEVCEWCGCTWTEGDSPHNGGCCDKDCEVMEATEVDDDND